MKIILSLFISLCFSTTQAQNYYMLVGTYDSPKSEGIYVYDFNSTAGTAKEISHVKTSNPSFLAVSKNNNFVYAINENADKNNKGGGVSSFSFNNKLGTLSFLNQQNSQGSHPCHITLDKTEKWVAVSNYSSGNLSIFPIKKNGEIDSAKHVEQHTGKGFDTARQKSPHVHASYFNKENTMLYVTDLGLDKVYFYNFKNGSLSSKKNNYVQNYTSNGPRHIAFSTNEKYVYVIEELAGKINVYEKSIYSKLLLKEIQTISTLPEKFMGAASSADIHISPDGNFLYASNRGESNTIAIFRINKLNGQLTLVGHQSTLGIAPRNFNFDPSGKFLIVANQNSDEIVIFKRDIITGLLTDTGNRISVGKPVCIQWIKK